MQFEIFDIQSPQVTSEVRELPLKIFEPFQANILKICSSSRHDIVSVVGVKCFKAFSTIALQVGLFGLYFHF